MNGDHKRLVVLFRAAEWQLNEMAFTVMRGTCTMEQRVELAETLAALVPLLRGDRPMVIVDGDRL